MPAQSDLVYKNAEQILDGLIESMLARVPDAHLDIDSFLRIFFHVIANEFEGQYLAGQLLYNDIWPQTADSVALYRFGDMFGYPPGMGTKAEGQVRFEGVGGTFIPLGAIVGAAISPLEVISFRTISSGTIPNPGTPDAPVAVDSTDPGNVTGTIEYVVTFLTLLGETAPGEASEPVTVDTQIVALTVPVGGPGTTGRKIYRMEDGDSFKYVATIADNTTTTYDDDIETVDLGSAPPEASTAERLSLTVEATNVGVEGNIAPQTVTRMLDVPDGVTGVTNLAGFVGGSNPDEIEEYRANLLQFIRDPQSGSPGDIKTWSEEVSGVDEATVFVNMNLEVATNGHVTVRISGAGGAIPDAEVVDAVLAALEEQDVANITIHVTTFDPVVVDVTLDVTTNDTYTLGDVTPVVQQAVADYINSVSVDQTVYRAGIVDAVFGLAGIENVTVSIPAADVPTASTEKAVSGEIVVT